MRSLGIYVHFPFCQRRCAYCDFATSAPAVIPHEKYLAAVLREMELRRPEFAGPTVSSIYLGGGTPGLMRAVDLAALLKNIRDRWPVADDCEISLEANPNSLTTTALGRFRECGVNRFSVGIQSFDDAQLQLLGRLHDAATARRVVQDLAARKLNFSIDLIMGLPGQTLKDFQRDVEQAFAVELPHLSIYQLTVEPGTPLHAHRKSGELIECPEETVAEMYLWLHEALDRHGMTAYEVSNFSRPGRACRHTQQYWVHQPYLGLGAGAHSFNAEKRGAPRRWGNIRESGPYIENLLREPPAFDAVLEFEETLTQEQVQREKIWLGLRTETGIPEAPLNRIQKQTAKRWLAAGRAVCEGGQIRLTPQGWLFLDSLVQEMWD